MKFLIVDNTEETWQIPITAFVTIATITPSPNICKYSQSNDRSDNSVFSTQTTYFIAKKCSLSKI